MFKKETPDEYKLIFFISRLKIDSSSHREIRKLISNSINWNRIIEISNRQQILPFLYYNVTKLNLQNIIPQDIFAEMKNCYFSNILRISMLEKEISRILELTNRKGITLIPFRGFSLSQTLYFNSGLRIMVDVDILIKKGHLQEIKNILAHLGYKESADDSSKSLLYSNEYIAVFSKTLLANQNIVIETHYALAPPRPYAINLPCLWERAQERNLNGQKVFYLSLEDTFLSLVLHLRRHTRPRRLALKFIVDLAELLNINAEKLDWEYIKESAENNHIVTTVYLALYLTNELLEASVSPKILNEFRPNIITRVFIHFTINKYNFFTLKEWQGIFLRLLLFDNPIDFFLYLWRVSFLKKSVTRRSLGKL